MATNKLAVANQALQLLGEPAVETLDDLPNSPSGAAINRQYDEVVAERMRAYAWSFLIQAADLTQTAAISPYNAAWSVYMTPNNIVRVVSVLLKASTNRAVEYRVDSDGIHAPNGNYLTVVFTRAKPEANWTPEFSRFIQAALALSAAGTNKADYVAAMSDLVQRRYEVARQTDIKASRGNNLQAFDSDGVVRAIGGGGSHRYGRFGYNDDFYGARGIYIPN